MKKIILLLFACFPCMASHAQIAAYFSHCAFNTPDNKPYMETYLSVIGNSISFKKNAKGKFQGQVEVGILFSKQGVIAASKKYNLLSPEEIDTINRPNFIDEQRFALDTGSYEIELIISDKNIKGKVFSMKENVKINFQNNKVNISDVEILSSFTKAETTGILTKNGYDLVPYNSDFFPENINELSFYAEVYNSKSVLGENEKFLISCYIESYESKLQLSKFTTFKKEITNAVNIVLSKFNITDLPSGNYNLVIEARDKTNTIVAQKKSFFQRKSSKAKIDIADLSNVSVENTFASRFTGKDTLTDILRSLYPISSESEKSFISNQLKGADTKLMQQFFYNFWQSRSQYAPEDEWKKYHENVKAVNAKFGTFLYRGYESDRGRVYLQYGPPDKREEFPSEPNAFPYEIWIYYTLNDKSKFNPNQTNKQFIFYTLDMVTNNFVLLHSDALSETHEPRWEMKLHSRTNQSNDFEQLTVPEHYGGNSHDEFNNPK